MIPGTRGSEEEKYLAFIGGLREVAKSMPLPTTPRLNRHSGWEAGI